ncbi:ABC transporter substrate-binding protein [Ochrobactrum sp. Q0168]|uniref:ABC transporter substrate-binding protein n=1 Tax=Ochrobactrum sp. Q0168 TaxID=2793241 RepID=UPI0018ECD405|nr:ABC transporter substrate-binding protein [Ochrobactrum sp. Q0168]
MVSVALSSAEAAPPQRVVSINVCTDQLAMLLAAPGQLQSVSHLSRDPQLSVLAGQAAQLPVNRAEAEEVFLLKPDLVLAGTFSSQVTVDLLRRLGLRVEQFAPARSFSDIETHLRRMGALLGREEQADAQIGSMRAGLAAIEKPQHRKTVALYFANSYTSGRGTLIDEAVKRAGLDNIADRAGVNGPAALPLEMLVMEKPDMLVLSASERAPALAFQNFQHPALRVLEREAKAITLPDNLTVCGGPFSVEAVAKLSEAARD